MGRYVIHEPKYVWTIRRSQQEEWQNDRITCMLAIEKEGKEKRLGGREKEDKGSPFFLITFWKPEGNIVFHRGQYAPMEKQ